MSPKKASRAIHEPSEIGLNVRRLRKRRGWTQAELAEKAELDKAQVGRLESGNIQEPERATVERLAKALGADPTEIDPYARSQDGKRDPRSWIVAMRGDLAHDEGAISAIELIAERAKRNKPD